MDRLVDMLLGAGFTVLLALISPETVADIIINILKWRFKKRANTVSNALGLKIARIGLAMIKELPDDVNVESAVLYADKCLDEVEKSLTKAFSDKIGLMSASDAKKTAQFILETKEVKEGTQKFLQAARRILKSPDQVIEELKQKLKEGGK